MFFPLALPLIVVILFPFVAISLNKKPPSDLFTDSLTFPSHRSSPIVNNDSSGEDELSGQGELTTVERKLADIKLEVYIIIELSTVGHCHK